MHIGRKRRKWQGGSASYICLFDSYRPDGGQPRQRVLYLGAEQAEDLMDSATKRLRRAGYTPAQNRAILEALRARVDRDEHARITVAGKLVAWRDNREKK